MSTTPSGAWQSVPALNELLVELLAGVQHCLGPLFVGLYLHGSLAAGDFDPLRSDIDFVVATVEALDSAHMAALAAFHARLAASANPWATRLEGSYIPIAALRRYVPSAAVYPALHVGGHFDMDGHGIDAVIQRHVLREQGIALAGPPPATLIAPITPDHLRHAARQTLLAWWEPQLTDFHRLQSREYQAYAVLTMCRVRYTVRFGQVVSKPVAAAWAQQALGAAVHGLIARALAWPRPPQPDELDATLALIRATLLDTARMESPQ